VAADSSLISTGQDLFLNLRLAPHLPDGLMSQRVVISWGANRHEYGRLASRQWISLPLRTADWTGSRPTTLTITIELPGAVAPHSVDSRSEDLRPLSVCFEELSISTRPIGGALLSAAGPPR
jgi:hypothetical protein